MKPLQIPVFILAAGAALVLAGCAGDGGTPDAAVGGTVNGLAAGSVVTLQENNSTILSVTGSSSFDFPATVPPDATYMVAVSAQPPGATCSVANASGTIDANGDPVQNVAVNCVAGTTVGGTVAGLASGATVTLTDGTTTLPVSANGSYAFTDLYANGASYSVSVATQPGGQTCTVANASGAVDAGGDPVAGVNVTCAASPTLGGTVSGLAKNASVTLSDGNTTTAVAANGPFTFGDSFAPGATYAVSIVNQPAGQTCGLANGAGAFDGNADAVSNVVVACSTNGTVGGSVSGLAANASITLTDGVSSITLTGNGSYAFTDIFAAGAAYAVTVSAPPSGQTCTVQNASGTLDANDDAVNTANVTCS